MPWIEVPDFGDMVVGWVDTVQDALNAAGDAVFGKNIKYNVVSSKAVTGASLYTVNIDLEAGGTQVVQVVVDKDVFHTFFHRHPNLDARTAAFISQFVSAMQSQWIIDPSKVVVQ